MGAVPPRPLAEDPDWADVDRITFVCFLPGGEVALRPDGTLPVDRLAPGEHPLDAALRIPLEQAGFRYQHVHPFALDGGHLLAWVDGDRSWPPPGAGRTGMPTDPSGRALVAEAAADRERLTDEVFERDNLRTLQRAYLRAGTPEGQSGFGRDARTWRLRRQQVADCVERSGTFLDVGCANGHLGESVARWCGERGLVVEAYGVDLGPDLVALARRRLPQWADRFWVGNARDWVHPAGRRFDAVHVLLDVVLPARRGDLVAHHLATTVAPGGRLLVSHHGARPEWRTDAVLEALGFTVGGWRPSRDRSRPSSGTAWIDQP